MFGPPVVRYLAPAVPRVIPSVPNLVLIGGRIFPWIGLGLLIAGGIYLWLQTPDEKEEAPKKLPGGWYFQSKCYDNEAGPYHCGGWNGACTGANNVHRLPDCSPPPPEYINYAVWYKWSGPNGILPYVPPNVWVESEVWRRQVPGPDEFVPLPDPMPVDRFVPGFAMPLPSAPLLPGAMPRPLFPYQPVALPPSLAGQKPGNSPDKTEETKFGNETPLEVPPIWQWPGVGLPVMADPAPPPVVITAPADPATGLDPITIGRPGGLDGGLVREPPGERVRERKATSKWRRYVFPGIGAVTESLEVIDAFWDALPKEVRSGHEYRGDYVIKSKTDNSRKYIPWSAKNMHWVQTRKVTPQEKLEDLWKHYDRLDLEKALKNVVENDIEDKVLGRASAKVDKATKPWWDMNYRPFGVEFGPAL